MFPFIFNLPWTILALLCALISIPEKILFSSKRGAPVIIVFVRNFWWYRWAPWAKGIRAMVLGHIILLAQEADGKDLEHEIVHVEQAIREPFIHPFLYYYQTLRFGYRANKYEVEAYSKAGNIYTQ